MSMGSDNTWVGKKPLRRLGGMSDVLSLAADLGFSVPPLPSQEELQNLSNGTGEKSDDLIRVLRELTSVQRKIADLQVELQGRKEDKNVAHLTHVTEMEKKIETLARITTILKDVIQNKDRIIARLQQPYSLDCIPVEAEYQKQFSELLMKAASDYGALTASVEDFQWTQNFKEPPSVWGEVKEALDACSGDEAPGLDGTSMPFIHQCWSMVKGKIVDSITEFYSGGHVERGCDALFDALIPKKIGAQHIKDFWPISLVGSVYKLVVYVLSMRKCWMLLFQIPTFVGGRKILDLVLVASTCGSKNPRIKHRDPVQTGHRKGVRSCKLGVP